MTPSITYLHLLRNTPFFTALTTDQLRWVIKHSREWEVQAQGIITSSQLAEGKGGDWVLLDGGWELRAGGQQYRSGHADPGKWFNGDRLGKLPYVLQATSHSYVMFIAPHDMDDMLAKGFMFSRHIDSGEALYQKITTGQAGKGAGY